MIKDYLQKIIDGNNLSFEEARDVINKVMSGEVNNSQIAGLLIALKCKGETAEEVAGAAQAMRDNSIKIKCNDSNVVDVCGTGGDNSNTFNISTSAAFVVAGTGMKVAKHGNRSISSKCGSADVLLELGVNLNQTPEYSEKALNDIGIAFLFAPVYHPAMKYAGPVRKELGMKSLFNILGPITNPAGTVKQAIGTFNYATSKLLADAVQYLNMDKVCFVCTENKFDEVLLTGETTVVEYNKDNGVKEYTIDHNTFGYPQLSLDNVKGEDAVYNAQIIKKLFEGNSNQDSHNIVVANASMGLYAGGFSTSLTECKEAAEDSIKSGKALSKLNQLIEFGNDN